MNSVSLMIGILRENIEHDLDLFESLEKEAHPHCDTLQSVPTEDFFFMEYYEGVGMVVPSAWLVVRMPEYQEKWEQFMEGQSCCMAGFYHRDVLRFLTIIERENDRNTG